MGPSNTGDDHIHSMSNGERKRMMAREHNRAYDAGELTKKDDLVDFVRSTVSGFQKALSAKDKK